MPVPDRLIAWGLPAVALSEMLTDAERPPVAVGLKVTLIVQKPLADNVLGEMGQLLVCPKSPELVPVTAMLEMVKLTLPVLVRVTRCGELVVFRA